MHDQQENIVVCNRIAARSQDEAACSINVGTGNWRMVVASVRDAEPQMGTGLEFSWIVGYLAREPTERLILL